MRIHLLFVTILIVALFWTVDTNAQSTMYPNSQPAKAGDPFDIRRIMNYWVHCEGETKDGGKVYRALVSYGAASQPTAISGCDQVEFHGHAYRDGSYSFSYGDISGDSYYRAFSNEGKYIIDQDNNLLVTLDNGNQLLVLTNELMKGILVIREISK